MTINYTTLLGLAKPVTGTETGQWGDVVNDQITSLLEDAVANASTISVTAGNVTLSTTTGASNQARMSTLILTGTPGTTRNVVAPSQSKMYVVINQSDGAVVIKGSATTGVTVGAGQTAQVAWNGSDFVEVGNYVHGNFVVNGNLSVNGNSTLGDGGADTTTLNGQFIAANSNISKSTTLTTSVPALTWIKGATYTDTGTAGGTTQAHAPFNLISAPTLSTSNIVTYTNASTLYIAGAPSAGGSATITNPYAMYVADGASLFGGNVSINGNTTLGDAVGDTITVNGTTTFANANPTLSAGTANGVAYLNGSKVVTSGSALTFDGQTLTNTRDTPILNLNDTAASNVALRLLSTGGITYIQSGISAGAFAPIAFTANGGGSEQMRLTSTGLGIGTSSPSNKLVVSNAGAVGAETRLVHGDGSTAGASLLSYNRSGAAFTPLEISGSYLKFSISDVEKMRLDSSGNLGLGVTPSAWGGTNKAIQLGAAGAIFGQTTNNSLVHLSANYVAGASDKYINSDFASDYYQYQGTHIWRTAPSGTAGNAITFTQAMTLDASGSFMVGATAADTSATKVVIEKSGTTVSTGAYLIIKNQNSAQATNGAVTPAGGILFSTYRDVRDPAYTAGITYEAVGAGGTNTGANLIFSTRGSLGNNFANEGNTALPNERGRFTNAGDFLVGTTTAAGRITVGTASYAGVAISGNPTSWTGADLYITRTGTESALVGQGSSIQLANSTNSTNVIIQNYDSNFQIFTYVSSAWNERVRVKRTGELKVLGNQYLDGNDYLIYLRGMENLGAYAYTQKFFQANLGAGGDPAYHYVRLCNAYDSGGTIAKSSFAGQIYFSRGDTGAGNFNGAVQVYMGGAYNTNTAGGVNFGNLSIDIVKFTAGGTVWLGVRATSVASSAGVTVIGVVAASADPVIIADGSASSVTVLKTLTPV